MRRAFVVHLRRVAVDLGPDVEAPTAREGERKDLAIPEKMLRRMLGVSGDGLHDRLMEFTRAVSGASFFAPPLRLLRSLGKG